MTNKIKILLLPILLALLAASGARAESARLLSLVDGEIGVIRTATGYSTVLEFESPVRQVVVGDQDAFKIEFTGTMVAIKPVVRGSSTNLFVTMEGRTFVFKVIPSPNGGPDYVVRVRGRSDTPEEDGWRGIGADVSANGLRLQIGGTRDDPKHGHVSIDFQLDLGSAKGQSAETAVNFQPGDLAIRHAGVDVPIEHLYLDGLALRKGQPVRGVAVIERSKLKPSTPLELRFAPDGYETKGQKGVASRFGWSAAKKKPKGAR